MQSDNPMESLRQRIADLRRKRERLSRYIDDQQFDLEPMEYAKLADMLSRLDGRIARLEKDLDGSQAQVDALERDLDVALGIIWDALDGGSEA